MSGSARDTRPVVGGDNDRCGGSASERNRVTGRRKQHGCDSGRVGHLRAVRRRTDRYVEARSQMVLIGGGGLRRRSRSTVDRVSAVQQKIKNPLLYEAIVSGLVSVFLLIGVVWSLPDSEIKRSLTRSLRPIASAAGLDQSWRMFAPEPIRRLETVVVRVTMADRAERVMTLAGGGVATESFSWYYWRKLKEQSVRRPAIRGRRALGGSRAHRSG